MAPMRCTMPLRCDGKFTILVLSDTHGNYPAAVRGVEMSPEADLIVHLGDTVEDARMLELACGRSVVRVSGNCDPSDSEPRELTLQAAGMTILACHGDLYGVKGGTSRLRSRAAAAGATVALFGHTHLPCVERASGILLVNPGTMKEGIFPKTFALVTLQDGAAAAEIAELPHGI
ncbi:MAG TPA: YfcE family phosphodiesterase [Verrucomicrobiae bacterium]|nr:YfcE family phosphodiesterase [Verrucomicrobiae bacterium]